MPNPEIIEETPINLTTLKSIFTKIKKNDEELNYRLSKMQEFFESVPVLTKKEADETFAKLKELEIPRLKDNMIQKILDLQPKTIEELKVIFQGSPISISKEYMDKIVKAL
jgi:DNA-directed RNA polymerase subunit F